MAGYNESDPTTAFFLNSVILFSALDNAGCLDFCILPLRAWNNSPSPQCHMAHEPRSHVFHAWITATTTQQLKLWVTAHKVKSSSPSIANLLLLYPWPRPLMLSAPGWRIMADPAPWLQLPNKLGYVQKWISLCCNKQYMWQIQADSFVFWATSYWHTEGPRPVSVARPPVSLSGMCWYTARE